MWIIFWSRHYPESSAAVNGPDLQYINALKEGFIYSRVCNWVHLFADYGGDGRDL